MKQLTSNMMKSTIEQVLLAHGLNESFNSSTEFHAKIENGSYMPLIIERHSDMVVVAHYFEQNGDYIPDPDMEFFITPYGWIPSGITFRIGAYRRAAIKDEEGKIRINKTEVRKNVQFSNMWARNIKNQGFIKK